MIILFVPKFAWTSTVNMDLVKVSWVVFLYQGASQIEFCYHKAVTLHPIPMQSHFPLRHDYVIFRYSSWL